MKLTTPLPLFGKRFLSILTAFFACLALFCATACSKSEKKQPATNGENVDFSSLLFTKTSLKYAEQFAFERCTGYARITIAGEQPYLVIDEGFAKPANVPATYTVLQKPLDKTYLVSSSVMDFICKLGAVESVAFCGTKADNWFIEEAVRAMNAGSMCYAGKYSAPDYELLLAGKTNLAIENTMIYHKPEVKEKLETLGIPVLIEKSSYEKNPLGKLEWIKLYGLLFDCEDAAETLFEEKIAACLNLDESKVAGKTIAFFYVMTNGAVNVRKPGDYIAKMIEMAGGTYFFAEAAPQEESALSAMNMQFEEFYAKALHADILIYNSTIDGMLTDKNLLLKKNALFEDFDAFKNDEIYCTNNLFFQETTGSVDFITDIHNLLVGDDHALQYLEKIQ